MNNKGFGTIIEIGKCLVSEDVIFEYFSCDYEKCKGKCCIAGEYGAPLLEEELDRLEGEYDGYSSLMSQRGRDTVDRKVSLCRQQGRSTEVHRQGDESD